MKSFVRKWLGEAEEEAERGAPRTGDGQRVYCIGDIHGRFDLLQELHGRIRTDGEAFDGDCTVVYLGDYIDRGLHSREVIDELLRRPMGGFESVCLLGNHEQTLLDFLRHPRAAGGWLTWGGRETLMSYGVPLASYRVPEHIEEIRDDLHSRLPPDHLKFIRGMPLMHVAGDYLFVHAGIRPGVPLQEQSDEDLLWIRHDFTEDRQRHEHVVVHGHSISEEVTFRANRIGIDTGAYHTGVLTCLVLEGEGQRLLQTGSVE